MSLGTLKFSHRFASGRVGTLEFVRVPDACPKASADFHWRDLTEAEKVEYLAWQEEAANAVYETMTHGEQAAVAEFGRRQL